MIGTDMRLYNYWTIGAKDAYGQALIPSKDAEPAGTVKMAINITSQATQDNINYKDCSYIGLTFDTVDDKYIIQYGDTRLKVLYVNTKGRYKQVFMQKI